MAYIKFELEDGSFVYIETTDTPKGAGGLIPSSRGDNAAQASASFDKSIETIRKMASTMLSGLREGFTEPPEEVTINFGLKASAELGNLVVARGGMEANYNVMLRWRSDKKEEPGKEVEKEASK
jgi:hypothetical protein